MDADETSAAFTGATDGLGDAAGACGGGPLATALDRFGSALTRRTASLRDAVDGAGDTLSSNADTYVSDDASAALLFDRWSVGDVTVDGQVLSW